MFRDWSILELVEVKRVSDVSGLEQVVYDEYNGLYRRRLAMQSNSLCDSLSS